MLEHLGIVEYISTHLPQMMAILEIALNFRTEDGKLRYGVATEKPVLAGLLLDAKNSLTSQYLR